MTRTKTTKIRSYEKDNEYLKLLALKISAKLERVTTTAEVLNGIIEEIREERSDSINEVSSILSNRIRRNLQNNC
jgi:hypothetical protein